jgi:hypothetical protein
MATNTPELKSVEVLAAEYAAEYTNESAPQAVTEDKSPPETIEAAEETPASEGQPQTEEEVDEGAVDEVAEPVVKAAPAEVKKPDPVISKGSAALAKKEQALRAEREAFKKDQGKVTAFDQLQQSLSDNKPSEFLKSLGITDITAFARRLLGEQMGANAPDDFKAQLKQDERDADIAKLKAELQKRDQQSAIKEQQQALVTAINGYLKSETVKQYPHLHAEASDDPADAGRRFAKKLNDLGVAGEVHREMTEEEIQTRVSEELEADIKREVERVKKRHLKDSGITSVAEKKPESKTVTNALTRATPSQQKKEAPPKYVHASTEDYAAEIAMALEKGTAH